MDADGGGRGRRGQRALRRARKWVGRFRAEGEQGLLDRSSAPLCVANRTPGDRVAVILALRQLRMTAAEIAETLVMPLSTVSAVLRRAGVGRLGRIGLEPVVRYERSRPGELVHVDVKKLGRIQGGAGKRIRGGGNHYQPTFTDRDGHRRATVGWEYVHVAVDVECPRFGGQLSAGLSGPAERLSGHATEAEVPQALSA
jgi:hypothetical protein